MDRDNQLKQEHVFVEYCIDCKNHQWCTNHREEAYQHWFEKLKLIIEANNPSVMVSGNVFQRGKRAKNHNSVAYPVRYTTSQGVVKKFPQLGAFEVLFRKKKMFSKLHTGRWPNCHTVAARIRNEIDGKGPENFYEEGNVVHTGRATFHPKRTSVPATTTSSNFSRPQSHHIGRRSEIQSATRANRERRMHESSDRFNEKSPRRDTHKRYHSEARTDGFDFRPQTREGGSRTRSRQSHSDSQGDMRASHSENQIYPDKWGEKYEDNARGYETAEHVRSEDTPERNRHAGGVWNGNSSNFAEPNEFDTNQGTEGSHRNGFLNQNGVTTRSGEELPKEDHTPTNGIVEKKEPKVDSPKATTKEEEEEDTTTQDHQETTTKTIQPTSTKTTSDDTNPDAEDIKKPHQTTSDHHHNNNEGDKHKDKENNDEEQKTTTEQEITPKNTQDSTRNTTKPEVEEVEMNTHTPSSNNNSGQIDATDSRNHEQEQGDVAGHDYVGDGTEDERGEVETSDQRLEGDGDVKAVDEVVEEKGDEGREEKIVAVDEDREVVRDEQKDEREVDDEPKAESFDGQRDESGKDYREDDQQKVDTADLEGQKSDDGNTQGEHHQQDRHESDHGEYSKDNEDDRQAEIEKVEESDHKDDHHEEKVEEEEDKEAEATEDTNTGTTATATATETETEKAESTRQEVSEETDGKQSESAASGRYSRGEEGGETVKEDQQQDIVREDDGLQRLKTFKDDRMDPTKSYPLPLELGKHISKKITYSNKTDGELTFYLQSSNPDMMTLKEQFVTIGAYSKGKFQLRFTPVDEAMIKVYHLYVYISMEDGSKEPLECIQIEATYE